LDDRNELYTIFPRLFSILLYLHSSRSRTPFRRNHCIHQSLWWSGPSTSTARAVPSRDLLQMASSLDQDQYHSWYVFNLRNAVSIQARMRCSCRSDSKTFAEFTSICATTEFIQKSRSTNGKGHSTARSDYSCLFNTLDGYVQLFLFSSLISLLIRRFHCLSPLDILPE
jgi:hypothetical protein